MRYLRPVSSATAVAVFLALLVVFCSLHNADAESASQYYKAGRTAEDRNDIISAFEAYKKAYNLKPAEVKYRTTYERVRVAAAAVYLEEGEKYATGAQPAAALAAFLKALDADPSNELAEAEAKGLEHRLEQKDHLGEQSVGEGQGLQNATSPPRLDISGKEPITLYMTEESRVIYEALGKVLGINVIFDPNYISKPIQVNLKEVTQLEALRILSEISDTFWKPVTPNTIFVAQDTRATRLALSQQAIQIFYLKNISLETDFNEIQTALRNIFQGGAKIYGVLSQNAIIMRGTPDELRLAKMLIAGLDQPKPEVLVDITVMEVSRDKLREIGLSPPTSLTISSGSSQTLNQIGRSSAYSISIGQAAMDFLLTDSDTRILQNPRLRAMDGQTASLKLGEKLPVATGSYTTATGSTSAAAETQFQYLDVGVNVEMTPEIHSDLDVTLKLSVDVSAEDGYEDLDSVEEPIISQQKAEEVVRLKNGQASILAGLVKQEVSHTVSGWPVFGEIPFMKYFFTTQSHEVSTDELVFMIVPHVVRAPQSDPDMAHEIDVGTDQTIQLREAPAGPASSTSSPHP
jgi:general secretion pathway protein D